MAETISTFLLVLHIINIFAAGYAVYFAFRVWREGHGSFRKTMRIILFAAALFLVVEVLSAFKFLPQPQSDAIQTLFSFVFLLLLIIALQEVEKGILAHEHLMKHKRKTRARDVE